MSDLVQLDPLLAWFAAAGFAGAQLEAQGTLLIVKLPPADRTRLLADNDLRRNLVSQARSLGFSRIALELTP